MDRVLFYREIDGQKWPSIFREENIRAALNYTPADDDVFIATYPKCGTTWMQQIVYLIFNGGHPPKNTLELLERCPFLDFAGQEAIDNIRKPGAFKTHFSSSSLRYSEKAKYIVVVRNPKDCCISYYYHSLELYKETCGGFSFDEYFDVFLEGEVQYGDYFDHLLGWYERRNDSNVLFTTYESMKLDCKQVILQVARFLGEEYHQALLNDENYLKNVIEYSNMEHMKKSINDSMKEYFAGKHRDNEYSSKLEQYNIIRKGVVGDWKMHFSDDQADRMNKKIESKLGGTDIYNFWKRIGCL